MRGPALESLLGSKHKRSFRAALASGETLLDSNHTKDHVSAELQAYAPLVTEGEYLMEAVEEFLAAQDGFLVDSACEKFFMTFSPRGFLRRDGARRSGSSPAA